MPTKRKKSPTQKAADAAFKAGLAAVSLAALMVLLRV